MTNIRRATESDADAVWPLTQGFATSFTPERTAFDSAFVEIVARDEAFLAVATGPSGVVGYVLAQTHPTLFANGPVAWVEEIVVRAEDRRSGVGRDLMDAVETWARDRAAAYVALATRRASEFYTALGYDESATFFRKLLDG